MVECLVSRAAMRTDLTVEVCRGPELPDLGMPAVGRTHSAHHADSAIRNSAGRHSDHVQRLRLVRGSHARSASARTCIASTR